MMVWKSSSFRRLLCISTDLLSSPLFSLFTPNPLQTLPFLEFYARNALFGVACEVLTMTAGFTSWWVGEGGGVVAVSSFGTNGRKKISATWNIMALFQNSLLQKTRLSLLFIDCTRSRCILRGLATTISFGKDG